MLVGPDALGQAPVEHDDLAEVAQHDVLALQVAVDDPPRMRVSHGVADADECRQQVDQPDRSASPAARFLWYARIASLRVRPRTNRMV